MGCKGSKQQIKSYSSKQVINNYLTDYQQQTLRQNKRYRQRKSQHQTNQSHNTNGQNPMDSKEPKRQLPKQDELLEQIDFTDLIKKYIKKFNLDLDQIISNDSNNQQFDIKFFQIVIKTLFTQIINDRFKEVNQNQINIKMCKIKIAQQLLFILVKSLKYVIGRYTVLHARALFKKLQQFSKTLMGYLKTKFPRSLNIDAGKLSQQFKQFDFTQKFNHDLISNAQIIFKTKNQLISDIIKTILVVNKDNKSQFNNQPKKALQLQTQEHQIPVDNAQIGGNQLQKNSNQGEKQIQDQNFINNQSEIKQNLLMMNEQSKDYADKVQITNTIKILLNKIMDQIDQNYSRFCALSKQIHQNFKVDRKISENTARCSKLDTGVVQITSIQVARVIIKWLQNLQEIIKKPQQILGSDYEMKITKKQQYMKYLAIKQINFIQDRSNSKQKASKYLKMQKNIFEKLINEESLIEQLKEEYKKFEKLQIQKGYDSYLKEFSINLLENLSTSVLDQTQITKQEMVIIKYTYQINNLISWIVEQKLVAIIKILIQICQKHKQEEQGFELVPNLIKFKVNDLMRCHLSGDQKTIKQAYDKILQKEQKDQIEIIKIKNRFHTQNHDAMIMFKMKGSFLICECQLALSEEEEHKNDQIIKNIQEINHFLYELQRSPFGIFGQLSVYLKTFSPVVSLHYQKLKLKPSRERIQEIKRTYIQTLKKEKLLNQGFKNQEQSKESSSKLKTRPYLCSLCLKYCKQHSRYNLQNIQFQLSCEVCRNCFNDKIKIENQKQSIKNQIDNQFEQLSKQIKQHIKMKYKKSYEYRSEIIRDYNEIIQWLDLKQFFQILPQQYLLNNSQLQNQKNKQKAIKSKHSNQSFSQSSRLNFQIQPKNDTNNNKINNDENKGRKNKKSNKIKAGQFMKFFDKTQSQAISLGWKIYFAVFNQLKYHSSLVLYCYNSHQDVIYNVYSPIEKYLRHQQIEFRQQSKILLFKNVWKTNLSKKQKLEAFSKKRKQKKTSENSDSFSQSIKNLCNNVIGKINQIQIFPSSHGGNSTDKKIQGIRSILNLCLLPFDYQIQTKIIQEVKPEIDQLYFIQFQISKHSNSKITFFINAQISKGSGERYCVLDSLLKLPKIKILKKNVNLSNLGADSQQIFTIHQVLNKFQGIKDKEDKDLISILKKHNGLKQKDSLQKLKQIFSLQWVKNIQNLDLSQNVLQNVDFLQYAFPNLSYLNISGNLIKQLKFNSEFKHLKNLKASHNAITELNNFNYLIHLQTLNLQGNYLEKFTISIPLQKLISLNLSSNPLTQINLNKAQNLQQLNLNEITCSDDQLQNYILKPNKLNKLRIFSFKNNKIGKFHNFLLSFPKLQKLNIENNLILFENLKHIYILYNQENNQSVKYNQINSKSQKNEQQQKTLKNIKNRESNIQQNKQDLFGIREALNNDQLYLKTIKMIKELLQYKVNFSIPVAKIKRWEERPSRNYQYYKVLINLVKKFGQQKLKLSFFKYNHYKQNQWDYLRQKSHYKLTNSTNKQARETQQKQNHKIYNYLYLFDKGFDASQHYIQSPPSSNKYHLIHSHSSINFKYFFICDWSNLTYFNLSNCKIDDKKWEQFVSYSQKFPLLQEIEISLNQITTVHIDQIQKFKSLKCIWFCDRYFDSQNFNKLTKQSIKQVQKYNKFNNPKKWVITNQIENKAYDQYKCQGLC